MARGGAWLTLAEAVTMLVYRGRCLTRDDLRERRRHHGGRLPKCIAKRLDASGERVVVLLRDRNIEAWAWPCERDNGTGQAGLTGEMARLDEDRAFLMGPVWIDPFEDAVWPEFWLDDRTANPVERGYKGVILDRAAFLATTKPPSEANSEAAATQITYRTGLPGRPTSKDLIMWEFRRRIEANEELARTVHGQAEQLHDWLIHRHPQAVRPKVKTISNSIGGVYRAHKGSQGS